MPIPIFISYARKHELFARQLATALSNSGAEVWVDIEDIPAGMNWSRAVQQGLDACEVMLVVITPESMQSRNVENEWQYYFDENKPVIPIRLVDAKTHFQLRRMQYIDFERQPFEAAYTQLLHELARLGFALTPPPEPIDDSPILPGVPLTDQSPIQPDSPLPLASEEGEAHAEDSPPADRMTRPLYEVASGAGGEVNYQPDPQTINLQSKYAAPVAKPSPLRRSIMLSPVLLAGIIAALVLGGLVTVFSLNSSAQLAPNQTQTALDQRTSVLTPGQNTTIVAYANETATAAATIAALTVTDAASFPDLVIIDMTILNTPVVGELVTASITIKNEGSIATGAFNVRVNLNGELSDQSQTVAEGLAPFERITLEFTDTPLEVGQPEAHAFVDVDGQVDEGDTEDNNSATIRYEVVAAPEATAEAIEAGYPDLVISGAYTLDIAYFGVPVLTRATITNIGNAPASGFALTSLYGQSITINETLEQGDMIEIDYPVIPDIIGSFTFDLVVDPDGMIDEGAAGEANNLYSVTVNVDAAPEATAEATEAVAYTDGFNPDAARLADRPLIVFSSRRDGDSRRYTGSLSRSTRR